MPVDAAWRTSFFDIVQRPEYAEPLKQASLKGANRDWTEALTGAVVAVCQVQGWLASAKGHRLDFLPESRSEYLGIDVVAFERGERSWPFPVAAIELENSRQDDRIAYSLWKVLCLRASLRIVFCYRPSPDAGPVLVRSLASHVVGSLSLDDRVSLGGDSVIVMGYRNKSETFPYGFFKWWRLHVNTGTFEAFP